MEDNPDYDRPPFTARPLYRPKTTVTVTRPRGVLGMSGAASAGASGPPEGTTEDYDVMLETLDEAIDEARRKIEEGRVRDEAKEKVRIKWVRALAYAVNVRRQVTTDRDLAELTEEVERLKEDRDVS